MREVQSKSEIVECDMSVGPAQVRLCSFQRCERQAKKRGDSVQLRWWMMRSEFVKGVCKMIQVLIYENNDSILSTYNIICNCALMMYCIVTIKRTNSSHVPIM